MPVCAAVVEFCCTRSNVNIVFSREDAPWSVSLGEAPDFPSFLRAGQAVVCAFLVPTERPAKDPRFVCPRAVVAPLHFTP